MKKHAKLLTVLLTGALLFAGCGSPVTDETDTSAVPETELTETESAETEAPAPVLTPSAHTISVEDVESILKANEMSLGLKDSRPYYAVHGGHQMRVVHTERGTYAIVVKYFNDSYHGNSEFYFVKVDNEENVSLIYYDEYPSEASTMQLNIGQDINGDVIGTVGCGTELRTYIFDAETDEVEIYRAEPVFSSKSDEKQYVYSPGYSQTMFDFANRKLYQFYVSCYETNEYALEWFTFDLETKEWTTTSICQTFPDILGRVNYIYPIADGNGGAYVTGRTGVDMTLLADEVGYEGSLSGKYAHDTMYLFHIPDLTSAENIEYKVVQEPDRSRAFEGIWSNVSHENNGHVFMDADGYLHIIYQFNLLDVSGNFPDLDPELHHRHAIFKGMESVYNEKLDVQLNDSNGALKPMLTQATDGTLYMILFRQESMPGTIEIYKANDALGTSWTLQATHIYEDLELWSGSVSNVRNGSTQDNTISLFFYTHNTPYHAYICKLSLEDYSITEPVDTLGRFDLTIDEYLHFYPYYSAHQNQVIHTENGTYAAFVYKYGYEYYDPFFCELHFCITKTDAEGKSTVLYNGMFLGDYEEFLNMQMLSDGKIYVCPPTGEYMYVVDPATDTVTEHEVGLAPATDMLMQQINIVTDPIKEKDYAIIITGNGLSWNWKDSWLPASIRMDAKSMNTEDLTFAKRAKMFMSDNVGGFYTNFYFFPDGNEGAYAVATRQVDPNYVEGLNFLGRTDNVKDSIALIYIDNLNKNCALEPIDIQAPYAEQAAEGIWSVVNMADEGDAYMDSEGKLHVIYSYYHMDMDDMDRPGNAELKANTFKRYHAVYSGSELISNEELAIEGLNETASLRMAETTDGTLYLLVCNTGEEGAKINVYFETEDGWALTQIKDLGEFTATSFSISSPRSGSVQNNVIDCIVYASDKDVYFTNVTFE
ncbi:MAG: hypothetical protein E7658_05865 [Ruminococcaceae bacterium]|nr:hypothetical protein [Oscillospiraceae bacterium]